MYLHPVPKPLLVIDAANVVGSVPDGWWRDRAGATTRLRDSLAGLAATGLPQTGSPIDVILVVEGKARTVTSSDTIHVHVAPHSGDDAIVDLVADESTSGRPIYVVTADRGLQRRVAPYVAEILGPHSVR
ncbi:histidine kinase [Kutzneria sp. 744]|nr:histidine kinase [Kutzneria sp. 744]